MPKTLRYGLVIAAIMGGLFLMAYVFRTQLSTWWSDYMPSISSVFSQEVSREEQQDNDSPFANKQETEETTQEAEQTTGEME